MTDRATTDPDQDGANSAQPPTPARPDDGGPHLVERLHNPVTARIILLAALVLTGSAWWFSHQVTESSARERFEFRASEIETAVVQRMQGYETVLWSGVGVMDSSESVNRQEWAEYVATLDLDARWPGIQGIGWSIPVEAADLADHEASIRAEGFPDYVVTPEGERDEYSAIVFLEPFDWRNQRAFGFDMWSNPERRAAMSRARDTGQAATSSMITLVQETEEDVQRGFLTYVPVYESGEPPGTVAARRDELIGWVYAPFRMNDLMAGILGSSTTNTVDFEIYDGSDVDPEQLLYSSDPEAVDDPVDDDLRRQITVLIQGHPWTMVFRPGEAFQVGSDALPTVVGVAGLIIELLLFYVVTSLGLLNKRTSALVDERTAELQATNAELAHRTNELERQAIELRRSNDELRQFAHVASHDLQEPLRTMASYSSLVSSTYGDELGPEGQRWLGYITGGAKRLSGLIREILQFSSVEATLEDHGPVDLNDVMDGVARDLAPLLVAEAAELDVEPLPEVVGYQLQLQRLLANLVHNAVKYHRPGVAPAISVGAVQHDDGWRIHVRDNGLGVEPEFHDRIFEVFRRAGSSSDRAGTGMGLAICRKIVRAHGGEIGVHSSLGHGAEFWFTLPLTGPPSRRRDDLDDGLPTDDFDDFDDQGTDEATPAPAGSPGPVGSSEATSSAVATADRTSESESSSGTGAGAGAGGRSGADERTKEHL